ncbi:hypothetical protein TELCIR_14420 [Teladorsagia circumcincta]|uniref:Cilia- and flagella-associated protein 36 n=1 Tax=Teladorsagia circumcincta TaxID=45464 RepID=A0A2G9U189_TELCI|nr:hypothetical protein TELCIR_14420 [Teladorsagia circumcincta]
MRGAVFDRQQGNVELYEQIHKEFSELVDTLVECFCADTNIPLETLREALKTAEADKFTVRQRTSLEPLAAAKDFNVFVPMMMRKNVELQLQALQMIEVGVFMCGLLPSVLQIEDGETLRNKARVVTPEETERYVLIAVMRQSKEEFDSLSKSEMKELEDVLRSSEEERRRLEMERGKEEELFSRALAVSNEKIFYSSVLIAEFQPSTEARKTKEDGTVNKSVGEKTEEELDEEGMMYGPRGKNIYDVNALLKEPNRLNSATIRSREEYLRMQRDRLLAMKANEREKQMHEVSQRAAQERPRTARAARGLMRGSRGAIGNDDVLAARRAIVDQLKTEIEDSSTS